MRILALLIQDQDVRNASEAFIATAFKAMGPQSYRCQPLPVPRSAPILLWVSWPASAAPLCNPEVSPSSWAFFPRILKDWLCNFPFFFPCILRGIKVFCCMFPFDQCHCSEVYTCKLSLYSGELVQVSWQDGIFAGSGYSSGSEWW